MNPQLPLLVACFTEPQLQIFRWNHQLARNEVFRIRTQAHVIGRRPDRPLLLLPKWYEGTDTQVIPLWLERGGTTIGVTEAQVLDGTFDWKQLSAPACTFNEGDKDPCPTCPRKITMLYACKLLQEEAKRITPA